MEIEISSDMVKDTDTTLQSDITIIDQTPSELDTPIIEPTSKELVPVCAPNQQPELGISTLDDPISATDATVQYDTIVINQIPSALVTAVDTPIIEATSKERIPVCAPELRPARGMIFENLKDGVQFYKTYAANAGFRMRLSNQRAVDGVVMTRYCVCSKAGQSKPKGKIKQRQKTRIFCKARIFLKRNDDGHYVVADFHEGHDHLLATPNTAVHLTEKRELTAIHKSMIFDNSKVNKGPTQTFRMFKEYVKGYNNVGASLEDFKNFWRDVKKFIKGYDAQMMIENFMQKKAMCDSFYFDFEVDDSGRLSRVFWADPISIKNYTLFGDMTSFDTTFNMNTYKMIFAPFTGVDHHKKCVTFGAGLLRNESEEGFIWLFRSFLKAMNGKYPVCIITDQDLGIKKGVRKVFGDNTHHRYCMWHIMKKVPDKIGSTIFKETNFMKDLCSCVWDEELEPAEFEERWSSVITSYGLTDHKWLKRMFNKRRKWIPAYFRDVFLGGLLRTTSRSESENSFFGNFMNPNLTLVEFLMRFESAMDAQRWKQSKLIAESKNTFPNLITPHPLEEHASEFYTTTVFTEFQEEWKSACFTCGVKVMGIDSSGTIPVVDRARDRVSYVSFDSDGAKLGCSCKKFERHGMLCRHALYVLKDQGFVKIPNHYLLARWSRTAPCQPLPNVPGSLIDDCNMLDVRKHKIGELWSEVYSCVTLAEQKPAYIDEFMSILGGFKDKLLSQGNTSECGSSNAGDKTQRKNEELEQMLGTKIPAEVVILPPTQSITKGSGKRLVSQKDKAVQEQKKPRRKCKACGELGFHDSRNCPGKL